MAEILIVPFQLENLAVAALGKVEAVAWIGLRQSGSAWLQTSGSPLLAPFAGRHADWLECVHPSARALYQVWHAAACNDPRLGPVEYRLVRDDERPLWVRHWLIDVPGAGVAPGHIAGVIQIIEEQKHLQAECLTASEREKASLGQELHDDICQILTGIHYLLGLIQKNAVPAVPELKETFIELRHQLDAGMGRTRALAHGLTPLRLVDENLSSALAALASQSRLRFGLKMDTAIAPVLPKHSPEQALHVYRIMQEAVANAVKHGQATRLKLKAGEKDGIITVSLTDNGVGFSLAGESTGGIGLAIMRSRARELCGLFSIEPARRGGTCVRLSYSTSAAKSHSTSK
jgi:signal transduction histidine kinase